MLAASCPPAPKPREGGGGGVELPPPNHYSRTTQGRSWMKASLGIGVECFSGLRRSETLTECFKSEKGVNPLSGVE